MTLTPHYAPTALGKPQRGQFFVIYSGLITTALTLAGVYWLNSRTEDFNIMGWYANYVIPVGAVIVGALAGCGYGIGSAVSGLKVSRRLLVLLVAFQVIAYFIAQYIEYRDVVARFGITALGFWEYFHLNAVSFAWKQKDGGMGDPLGYWGYAFRALEIAGFALGGLIVPAVMMARPYCDTCRRYMKTRDLGVIPAAVPARKVKKSDTAGTAAYEAEQQQALEAGTTQYERVVELIKSEQVDELRPMFATFKAGAKAADKLPRRIKMSMVMCPRCNSGRLASNVVSGTGDKAQAEALPPVELPPDTVRGLANV